MTESRKGFDVEVKLHGNQHNSTKKSKTSRREKASLLGHEDAIATNEEAIADGAESDESDSPDHKTFSKKRQLPSVGPEEDSEHMEANPSDKMDHESGEESLGVHESHIHNLIVTTKAYATAKALKPFAHRLTTESTILFLQNGIGVIDEVNEICFPDPETRPQYMIGVNSHGLKQRNAFDVVHAGAGTIALGILPGTGSARPLIDAPDSSRYLLRTMVRVPVLVAVGFAPTELLQQQLDKLAINAVINPITAILDIKNGNIDHNFFLKRVIRLLLAEVSLVIRSLPELQNVVNVKMRFDPRRLERLVWSVAELTAVNESSMLQDVWAQGQTEIDYINGYIVKRGEQLGIHCVVNYMLVQLIKARGVLVNKEKEGLLPFGSVAKF
ncbi:uncharacterized protein KY384_001101 [Bacidia gigantensis]|uniref:uncharacterized protein n=1 Tax=Bacidia gigantensis TaxID=2732470 RepID=UPI001D054576|nr:uncharacterized protein KY384_001101 [Bacidia gigantensis]KAG8534257.1 hypothetical protein KY384_001101 [Bacidia gigantensis]